LTGVGAFFLTGDGAIFLRFTGVEISSPADATTPSGSILLLSLLVLVLALGFFVQIRSFPFVIVESRVLITAGFLFDSRRVLALPI